MEMELRDEVTFYENALKVVRTIGEDLLKHGDDLSPEFYDAIEEIDINIHYILNEINR